jgi:hypothetical protein
MGALNERRPLPAPPRPNDEQVYQRWHIALVDSLNTWPRHDVHLLVECVGVALQLREGQIAHSPYERRPLPTAPERPNQAEEDSWRMALTYELESWPRRDVYLLLQSVGVSLHIRSAGPAHAPTP